MKKLIYTLTFLALPLFAFGVTTQREVVDPNTGNQIVSMVKDKEVEAMLAQTSEFKDCRDKYTFEASDDEPKRTKKIEAAEACFKEKLSGGGKNEEQLKKLSETLNLQHYGLVQSENIKAVQSYLSDKMYKSLTGVDRSEKNKEKLLESMKFKNKKHIDQKIFIDMYKTQLGKNALYEVSRFCFENLRSTNPPPNAADTFSEHWSTYDHKANPLTEANVNDSGSPAFGTMKDPNDKNKVFEDIFTSIQGTDKTKKMSDENLGAFFMQCGKLIAPLCEAFKTSNADLSSTTTSKTELGVTPPGTTATVTTGAAACLAKSRIQAYRKALADSELFVKRFQEMGAEDQRKVVLGLDKNGDPAKMFGTDANDSSIDDLTNNTATDIFEGGVSQDELNKDAAEKCEKAPELDSCKGFISEGDSLAKAKQNVELEMTLQREVEMERVRKLVAGDKKSLNEYLESNGHFDVIKEMEKTPGMNADQISKMVGSSYEAKKAATLAEINRKLGKRQVAKDTDKDDVKKNALEVVKESKEERARLAQVVMFNNIITSHLVLKKKDGSGELKEVGRNVNAWKKEEAALTNASVNPELFENLKTTDQGLGKENQIAGFELLDELLGKEEKKTP